MLPKSNKPVWNKYSRENFVIMIPGQPQEEVSNVAPGQPPIPFHNALIDLGRNGACIVGYADTRTAVQDPDARRSSGSRDWGASQKGDIDRDQ